MVLPFAPARAASSYPNRLQASSTAPPSATSCLVDWIALGWFTRHGTRRPAVFLLITWLLPLLQQLFPSSHHPCQAPIVVVLTRFTLHDTLNESNPRRLWDPGKVLIVSSLQNSSAFASAKNLTMVPIERVFHHVQGEPAAAAACGKGSTPATRVWLLLLTMMQQRVDPLMSPLPLTMMRALSICVFRSLFRSLFHYFHPSLTRPTVPNI